VTTLALTWQQFRFERRLFWRNPSALFFNFSLPVIFLVLIGSVFSLDQRDLETLVPGIAGMAVMTTTFNALAFNLTFIREQGIIKRMRGTPLPSIAYFGGVLANAVMNAAVQVALIVVLGHVLYDVSWPQNWIALAVFTALGVTAFGALGVAFAQVIPNFDSAPAYVNAFFLPMIFISGAFYDSEHLPSAIEAIAEALPLKHVIDGLHAAIVTGDGVGQHMDAVGVLSLWCVLGLFFAVRRFRFE
jgi:ABC-2 type transport system permease protein